MALKAGISVWMRLLLVCIVLIIAGFLLRGWLYRQLIIYESVGQRTVYAVQAPELVTYIEQECAGIENGDIQSIIQLGLSLTSRQLNFTTSNNNKDPNKLIESKTAHCVGYAAFFTSTCNFLLRKFNLDGAWTAKHQIGQLYLFGANIHHYFNTPFFKDHDFVTIENKATGVIFAVDPSVNDYLLIDFVNFKKQ